MERHDTNPVVAHQLGHVQRLPLQRNGTLIEREPLETRAELGGESLQPVQRPFLLERLGIAFEGRRRAEKTGAAEGAFLLVLLVRRRVRTEEELRIARRRRHAQCLGVKTAFCDRQAVRVRPEPALERSSASIDELCLLASWKLIYSCCVNLRQLGHDNSRSFA